MILLLRPFPSIDRADDRAKGIVAVTAPDQVGLSGPCDEPLNYRRSLANPDKDRTRGGTQMNQADRLILAAFAATIAIGGYALAHDITTEWGTVKPPPVPQLKPVTVDPKTTALLVLDMMKGNCGVRPRCTASVPSVKKLVEEARAHNMMIAFNLTGQSKPEDMIDAGVMPRASEYLIKNGRGADKFIDSDLAQTLKGKGIKTVIVTGTSAQGAVSGTSNGAAQRGFEVVVPVDGMSSEDPFNELYAAWHLYKGGPAALVDHVTLSRSDLIKYGS
jgi:nicotinamidase-related amidase